MLKDMDTSWWLWLWNDFFNKLLNVCHYRNPSFLCYMLVRKSYSHGSKSPWTLSSPWKVISIRSSKVLEIQPLGLPLTTFGIKDMIMQKRICSWTYKDYLRKEVAEYIKYWKIKEFWIFLFKLYPSKVFEFCFS